jgi:two-component system chemotaxis sensor kinase CheA
MLGEPAHAGEPDSTLQIVVLPWRGRSIGLIAGRLIDIVEQIEPPEPVSSHGAVGGSTVLLGRVTDVLDVDALLAGSGLESFAPETHMVGE